MYKARGAIGGADISRAAARTLFYLTFLIFLFLVAADQAVQAVEMGQVRALVALDDLQVFSNAGVVSGRA